MWAEVVLVSMSVKLVCPIGGRAWPSDASRVASGQVEGALEYGITSDDIFWLKESPGKT